MNHELYAEALHCARFGNLGGVTRIQTLLCSLCEIGIVIAVKLAVECVHSIIARTAPYPEKSESMPYKVEEPVVCSHD